MNAARIGIPTALLLIAQGAGAVDGVLEINQTCAVNTGCFLGDAAGFPVEVTMSGSVRLTGNLTVPDENTTGIIVSAEDVTIDLNGFSILGPTVCTFGPPVTCTPTGSGNGISAGRYTTVLNGTIRGLGDRGIFLSSFGKIIGVNSISNGGNGIRLIQGGLIKNCVARLNDGAGFVADSSVIRESVSDQNGFHGIDSSESTVIGNTVTRNVSFGLSSLGGPTGYGHNQFDGNNGGNANPQVQGGLETASNVCGGDLVCP